MLASCAKSCGSCHYTQVDIDKVVATPCEDSDSGCPGANAPVWSALIIDANLKAWMNLSQKALT